jgi:hypothetical protein
MDRLNKTYLITRLGLDPKAFDRPVKVVQF